MSTSGAKPSIRRDLFPYLFAQMRPYRLQVAVGILATAISVGLDQLTPHFVGILIDGLRSGWGVQESLRTIAMMLLAAMFAAGLLWAQRYYVIRGSRAMEHDIRQRLFERLQAMPPAFFDKRPTGELMTLASSDLDRVRDVLGPAILHLFRTILFIVYAVGYLLWRDWELALWGLAPLVFMPFLANRAMMAMHAAYARIQGHLTDLSNFTHDAIAGIGVVKGYGRETTFAQRMDGLSDALRKATARSAWATGALWPAVTALGGVGMAVLLWRGAVRVHDETLTVGTLATATMLFFRLQWPLIGLGWVSSMLQRGATSLGRLQDLEKDIENWERSESELSLEHLPPPRATPPLLEVRRLSFRYAPDRPWVLRDLSFTLEPGQGLGIAGGPGSGKTTLLHLVSGLRRPPPASIFLDGQDLSRVPAAEAAARFALVPQDGFLFSATIAENLAMGRPDGAPDHPSDPWLAASCFDQDLPQIPQGLQAVLGERGINLSGGQRQRLALARALAKEASILLLDDTLSAVDAQTETRILERLAPHLAGRSLLLASHRYSAFRFAARVLVLENGQLAEEGTHEDLIARGGYYARAWQLQSLEEEIASA
ncbi:MAG: ABC transporter ATP-binding protein [Fibrobacteria bacterium]|nr:ABC transporter ATP-binding protein [Fibrobacteria bacterium]